ncbi:Importin 9 [Quaeritorhiza haematococci]|nr:Importin 9 [Quaeritorhiza haematococci]
MFKVKREVRATILNGLGDPLSKIRAALAYVVSKIAHVDWPESWPDLFDALLNHLKSPDSNYVHGAMCVLVEFVRDDMTDAQFPRCAEMLIPELYRIFDDAVAYSPLVRARAVTVLREMFVMLDMVQGEHPEAINGYLLPLLPTWLNSFLQKLSSPTTTTRTTGSMNPGDDMVVKQEIFKTLEILIKRFPKQMATYVTPFVERTWNILSSLKNEYVAIHINPVENAAINATAAEVVDSEGESVSFDRFIYSMFDFLAQAVRMRSLRSLFSTPSASAPSGSPKKKGGQKAKKVAGTATPFLEELIGTVLVYMRITEEQVESWEGDVGQYVKDEDDETFTFNVRVAGSEMLMQLLDTFRIETLDALLKAVHNEIASSPNPSSASAPTPSGAISSNWWKVHESCLFALGRSAGDLIEAVQGKKLVFDLGGLLNHVVLEDMRCVDAPFLQGRAIWFASQFAGVLPSAVVSQYVGAAVVALGSEHALPVRISALRALQSFSTNVERSVLEPFQAPIIEGVAALGEAAGGTSEETVALVLETLTETVKINHDITAKYEEALGSMLMKVWSEHSSVGDLFEALAANPNPAMSEAFRARMVPALCQAIVQPVQPGQDEEEVSGFRSSAIDFLKALIKNGPASPLYISRAFPVLVHLLLATDNHNILQSGQECLKAMVQKDFAGIAQWSDGTQNGLQYTMQFLAKLLHPSQSESAAVFVGDLIVKLIQKGGNVLVPVIPDILKAVTERLQAAERPSFIQTLVLVFAHLFQIDSERANMIAFLSSLQLPSSTDGLTVLLRAWSENYSYFTGYYSLKVSAVAMCKLFMMNDPRLQAIEVKGDLVVNQAQSNPPEQYTSIPFTVKAIKLLLADFIHNYEGSKAAGGRAAAEVGATVAAEAGAIYQTIAGELGGSSSSSYEGTEETGSDVDDEEWEDEDELEELTGFCPVSEYQYLSDLIDENDVDLDGGDEADEDPEVRDDPIYHMNVQEYLMQFFKTCAAQNVGNFLQICEHYLTAKEQAQMKAVLK